MDIDGACAEIARRSIGSGSGAGAVLRCASGRGHLPGLVGCKDARGPGQVWMTHTRQQCRVSMAMCENLVHRHRIVDCRRRKTLDRGTGRREIMTLGNLG